VHEIVRETAPQARVVYVDIDPVAVAHGRALLAGDDQTVTIQQDARNPEQILADPDVRRLLDPTRPVALLLASVLHFIPDSDDPAGILATLRDAVGPGSYLVISHVTVDDGPGRAAKVPPNGRRPDLFARPRRPAEVERFFAGFELVDPGLVPVEQWRRESPGPAGDNLPLLCMHAGVGRRR
jgi:SAM-dependent methyltransferase